MKSRSQDRHVPVGGILKLLVLAVVAGVVMAGMALPAVGVSGVSTKNALEGFWSAKIEDIEALERKIGAKTILTDTKGKEFAELYETNREEIKSIEDVSPEMQAAVVAIEDNRFFQHGAMDLVAMMRALAKNASAGGAKEGASTLTQQYVKQVRVYSQPDTKSQAKVLLERDLNSKLLELRFAVNVEQQLSREAGSPFAGKLEILRKYLSVANFGDASYGVKAAAERYFGKTPKELKLNESAMLAALLKDPTGLDPTEDGADTKADVKARQEKLKARRNLVLDAMLRYDPPGPAKPPSEADVAKAKEAKLPLKVQPRKGNCVDSEFPYFCEYVKYEMLLNPLFGKTAKERKIAYETGGYTIKTTLDRKMQTAAEKAIRDKVKPDNPKVASEALIVPGTGHIRAMAASMKFGLKKKKGEINYNIVADRAHGGGAGLQIGSTAKAFTLATALKEGKKFGDGYALTGSFTPSAGFTNCEGAPVNATKAVRGGKGGVSMLEGTKNSINGFFMKLEQDVGLCDTAKTAKAMGLQFANYGSSDITKSRHVVPTFTLGVAESNAVTMAAAYATFAAKGKYCKPLPFTEFVRGGETTKAKPKCNRALDEAVANAAAYAMSGVWSGTMSGAPKPNRPAAGKTGTTDLGMSINFGGYTPDLAGFVNMGDYRGASGHPMGNSYFGASIPGPIFVNTINAALAGEPKTSFPKPEGRFFGGSTPRPPKEKDKCDEDSPFPIACEDEDEGDDDGPAIPQPSNPIWPPRRG